MIRSVGGMALASAILWASGAVAQIRAPEVGREVSAEVDEMYQRGLRYLVSSQGGDGSWSGDGGYGGQPGVVALALMAMLARGDDPEFGPYAGNVRRAVEFLLKQSNPETGYIGQSMYNHGFATLALSEVYGTVDIPGVGTALKRAVDLIIAAQKRNGSGAWRYNPESFDADSTVAGCQIVALLGARNAGVAVPDEVIERGLEFILSCQTADGGVGYMNASGPNQARTAILMLCLDLTGKSNTPPYNRALRFMRRAPPESDTYFHYFLYYAAQAWFRVSDQAWEEWNRVNVRLLRETQNPDGSWPGNFGSSFTTSACLLSLALNYRFLPIYER
ncbi:MAG: prenyltransferase/squalene oxidase repeat-containing protein [Verrucomicrobiia bacterium]